MRRKKKPVTISVGGSHCESVHYIEISLLASEIGDDVTKSALLRHQQFLVRLLLVDVRCGC